MFARTSPVQVLSNCGLALPSLHQQLLLTRPCHTKPTAHCHKPTKADGSVIPTQQVTFMRCPSLYRYHFRRLWWGGVLRDQTTLALVFLLLVLAASALLGYWPVIQAILGIPPSADFNPILHFANGLIIFGLIGSIGMLMTACCGCTVPRHPGCESGGSCDTGGCDCSGGDGTGQCLACILCIAVIGFLLAAQAAYVRWVTWVSCVLHTLAVMVENVGPVARKRAVARAARKGSKEAGGRAKEAAVVAEGADAGAGTGGEAGAATQAPTAACMV